MIDQVRDAAGALVAIALIVAVLAIAIPKEGKKKWPPKK